MSINIFNILTGNNDDSNALIPSRDPGASTGSSFIDDNFNLAGLVRETNILNEIIHGNIPNFLRKFSPITVSFNNSSITYLVMPDYLCIGSDEDYVRMPMNPLSAQKIADKFDCTLPTKKMVDDIWKNSVNKIEPLPWGAPYDFSMMSTERIKIHNERINKELAGKDPTKLTSGHKKDVVLSNKLYPNNPNKRVCIYGWIHLNGESIQGLNYFSHEDTYSDYSHSVRLIAKDVIVNGNVQRIDKVFDDKILSSLVSDEGPLKFKTY